MTQADPKKERERRQQQATAQIQANLDQMKAWIAQQQNMASPTWTVTTSGGTQPWTPGTLLPGQILPTTTIPTQQPLPYPYPTYGPPLPSMTVEMIDALGKAQFDIGGNLGLDVRLVVCRVCKAAVYWPDGGATTHRNHCDSAIPATEVD